MFLILKPFKPSRSYKLSSYVNFIFLVYHVQKLAGKIFKNYQYEVYFYSTKHDKKKFVQ